TYMAMLLVFSMIHVPETFPFSGLRGLLAFVAIAAVNYVLNTLLVGTIVVFVTQEPPLQIYRANYQSITWIRFITSPFGAVLAAILGHAQLGLASPLLEEKDRSLGVAMRVCQRGRSITTSLLTFARRHETQRGVHHVHDTIEDTLALVEHELAKNNIHIVRRF